MVWLEEKEDGKGEVEEEHEVCPEQHDEARVKEAITEAADAVINVCDSASLDDVTQMFYALEAN